MCSIRCPKLLSRTWTPGHAWLRPGRGRISVRSSRVRPSRYRSSSRSAASMRSISSAAVSGAVSNSASRSRSLVSPVSTRKPAATEPAMWRTRFEIAVVSGPGSQASASGSRSAIRVRRYACLCWKMATTSCPIPAASFDMRSILLAAALVHCSSRSPSPAVSGGPSWATLSRRPFDGRSRTHNGLPRVSVGAGMKWPRRLSLAALAVLAVGCGQQTVSSAAPSPPAPSRAPNAAPTPAPKRVLIAVTDDTTVRLVDLHGQEVAHTALSAGQPVGAGGDFVAFVNGTSLKALHANGTVTTLGSLPGYQSMPVLFSPDGRQWLWATTTFAGSIASSSVLLSSPGEPDRTVAQHSGATDHRALYPFRWTPAGPVYSSGPVGIGGYILFNTGYSPSWLVDPSTAQSTPLLGGKCAVADVAADGTVACFDGAAVPNA